MSDPTRRSLRYEITFNLAEHLSVISPEGALDAKEPYISRTPVSDLTRRCLGCERTLNLAEHLLVITPEGNSDVIIP